MFIDIIISGVVSNFTAALYECIQKGVLQKFRHCNLTVIQNKFWIFSRLIQNNKIILLICKNTFYYESGRFFLSVF